MSSPARDLRQFLSQVPDPRGRKGTRHPLSAILTAVICAVLCGANGYRPIVQWLHQQPVDFWHFLGFTRRPLKYGALRNLLMMVSGEAFEAALAAWLRTTCRSDAPPESLQGVSIDGKALRGSRTLDQRAIMLISAFDHETAHVLRQCAVPAETNEQKAGLHLLRQLVLTGRVVTADAAHCQQETCEQIVDSGGHYVITAKKQSTHADLRNFQRICRSRCGLFPPTKPSSGGLSASSTPSIARATAVAKNERSRPRPL